MKTFSFTQLPSGNITWAGHVQTIMNTNRWTHSLFLPLSFVRTLAVTLCAALLAGAQPLRAEEEIESASLSSTSATITLTPEQIDSLVAPIALYPDPLLSQVLVASTYPLEVVEAQQWVEQNPSLKGEALTQAAQQQSWDASVQALVVFPDVLKRLSQNISWTTNLGNAFLANQENVMDSVQRMRGRAQDTGKLPSTDQQKVVSKVEEGRTIIQIEPASPDVIYVPYYDPVVVWGPSYYYPYPRFYYPTGAVLTAGLFWFGTAVVLSSVFSGWGGWHAWGWRPYWHRRTVYVNNVFIDRHHFHSYRGSRGESAWRHDVGHRRNVRYPDQRLIDKYHVNVPRRPNAGDVQHRFRDRQLPNTRQPINRPDNGRRIETNPRSTPNGWNNGSTNSRAERLERRYDIPSRIEQPSSQPRLDPPQRESRFPFRNSEPTTPTPSNRTLDRLERRFDMPSRFQQSEAAPSAPTRMERAETRSESPARDFSAVRDVSPSPSMGNSQAAERGNALRERFRMR